MSVPGFYAPSRITQIFSARHSGLDFAWGALTPIPSPVAGKVAAKGTHDDYGHWVAVEVGRSDFVGVAHMAGRSPLDVGDPVKVSTTLGLVGSTGDFADGNHAHLYRGADPRPWARPKVNPASIVAAGIAAAGGTATPIKSNGDNEMRAIRDPNGGIALVGETTYQHLTLAQWAVEAKLHGAYVQLTAAEFNAAIADTQVRRAYLLAGVSGAGAATVDVGAIVAKVSADLADDFAKLGGQIAAINTELGFPTLAQIADAVNDDAAARLDS